MSTPRPLAVRARCPHAPRVLRAAVRTQPAANPPRLPRPRGGGARLRLAVAAVLLAIVGALVTPVVMPAAAQKAPAPKPVLPPDTLERIMVCLPDDPACFAAPSVTPDGGSVTASAGTNSYTFTVTNVGQSTGSMSASAACSGAGVSGCTASPTGFALGRGASRAVTVTYTAASVGGTATVGLMVDEVNGNSDDGSVTVTLPALVPSYTVSVTPDAAPYAMAAGSTTYNFTVTNTGNADATYTLTPSCAGAATGCSAPGSVFVAKNGGTASVGVAFSATTPGGTGTVSLTASAGGYTDGGSVNVSVNHSYSVAVTPDGDSQLVSASSYVTFYVENTGSAQANYSFSAQCAYSCSPTMFTATINPGPANRIQVSVGLNGSAGNVTLWATDNVHSVSDRGNIFVVNPSYTVSVDPKGSPDLWREAGQAGQVNFTVANYGNSAATYSLSGSCDGGVTGCSAPPSSVAVGPGGSTVVPITFAAGSPGTTGNVRLSAGGPSSDAGYTRVIVFDRSVAVTPNGASVAVEPGTSTQTFTITNNGNVPATYSLVPTCSGVATGCSLSATSVTVTNQTSTPVTLTYGAATRGASGTIRVTATATSGSFSGFGNVNVSVNNSYSVAVTPDGDSQLVSASSYVTFYVENTGTAQATYNFSAQCAYACSPSTSWQTINPGPANRFPVTVGLNGSAGNVTLWARDDVHGVSDRGNIFVVNPNYAVDVTPDTTAGTVAQPVDANKSRSQVFSVYNAGNSTATYTISVSCPATYIVNCSYPTSLPVSPQTSGTATVNFTAGGTAGVGTITLTATGPGTSDAGTAKWQVNTHYVAVTPKGGTASTYVGSGRTQVFAVKNTGNVPNSYTVSPLCAGTTSSCTAAPVSISNLGAGLSQNVTVTYTASGAGAGTLRLAAANTVDVAAVDTGSVTVTVKPTYTVAVTPDGATPQVEAWTEAIVPFTIRNNGTATGRYALTRDCWGTAVRGPCTWDATDVVIPAGQSVVVRVRFPAGAPTETARLGVMAVSLDDGTFSDAGSATLTVTAYAVSVTPDAQAVSPAANATETRPFTVTNTGTTTRTFTLQPACAPPAATGCSVSPGTLTLGANVAGAANVTYTAGDPNAKGTVRLVATDAEGRSTDAGTLAVTVGTTVARNAVQFKDLNPGTTIARSQCLVFSIVPDVAHECGALRIVHPLPAVRTLGKARVPTLIYSSDQVSGPTLAVNVTLADTTTIPQTVQLIVARTWPNARRDTVTRYYTGSEWQGSRRRRLAVPAVAYGPTGIVRYSVEVWLQYATQRVLAAPVDSSELAVVDRSGSPFGGGWWLAGLEQLYPGQYDTSVLWVGGDGSTRKYVNQRTLSGTDTVYLAAAFDGPDTLLHRPDGMYRRQAGNGLFIEFDGLGLHRRTVNRLGYPTVFTYDGRSRLSALQLPPWRGSANTTPAHSYTFAYGAGWELDTVIAPPVNGQIRKVALTRGAGSSRVVRFTELLGDSTYQVNFDAGWTLLYGARSDRRGVPTTWTYEASSPTIATFATGTGIGTDTVRHTFRTAGAMGPGGISVPVDSAYFRYDGPRLAPVLDVTKLWVDRFGAPTRIINALGQETTIARGDPRFPALVTEVRGPAPNAFATWATYDARGNLRATTQVNPHDDGKDATTTYGWHPTWNMVTQIVQPEGEVTAIGYDPATGDRLWQEDGRGLPSRVSFAYYSPTDLSAGAMARLLSTITLPATTAPAAPLAAVTTRVTYDSLGNVNNTWTPRGAATTATNDAIGRTTGTTTQIGPSQFSTTTLSYDLVDRVIGSVSSATPMNGVGPQSAMVDNFYDREGRLERIVRRQTPESDRTFQGLTFPALGGLISRYAYDNLGRKVAEIAPDSTPAVATDNPVDSTFYDLAGNVERVRTRRNDNLLVTDSTHHVIVMTYDALNRLKTRAVPEAKYRGRYEGYALTDGGPQQLNVSGYNTPFPRFPNNSYSSIPAHPGYANWGGYTVPAFTATFDYDEAGNMTIADNAEARVRRQYYPNGQMRRDSLYTKTLERDVEHKYGLEYLYDRNGRPTTLKHPDQLSAGTKQSQSQYDRITGALAKVIDPLNHEFTFGIDERNQPTTLGLPRNFSERYGYDQDGDLISLWSGAATGALHNVTMTYDLRGKMLTLSNAVTARDTITMQYSGLGHLVSNNHITWLKTDQYTRRTTTEAFAFDPLGNRQHSEFTQVQEIRTGSCSPISPCSSGTTIGGDKRDAYYQVGTGRLALDSHDNNFSQDVTKYDESGNIVFGAQRPGTITHAYVERASFYGADGTLGAVDYRQIYPDSFKLAFDEYRYDALGRRVVVRSQRICRTPTLVNCTQSYVRRTVWAGAQELYEIQMPDAATVREYDTEALVPKARDGDLYDPNLMYGRVAYTFGQKLDQPLSITRFGYMNYLGEIWAPFSIVPLWTTRGTADTSYFAATGSTNCNAAGRCVQVGYQDEYWTPAWRRYYAPPMFFGSLFSDKADHSGQLFRRNRYYDPATGRFTQEDPIGLGGGLNTYGFANGDPVSYSDPFGLCPNPLAGGLGGLQCALEDLIGGITKGPGILAHDIANSEHKDFVIGLATVPLTFAGGLEKEGVKITTKGMVHVLEGHVPGGEKAVGKSIFHAAESLVDLVRGADGATPVLQSNGNLRRVVNAGREIGVDRATQAGTSTYTVITNRLHELVTMFPGTSP